LSNLDEKTPVNDNPNAEPTTGANPDTLIQISLNMLFPGMVAKENIFCADAKTLIVSRGTTLTQDKIKSIYKFNGNKTAIYVSNETYMDLVKRTVTLTSRAQLEEETGYTEVKDETLKILDQISHDKNVPPEAISKVSEELSESLRVIDHAEVVALINAMSPVDEYLQRHSVNVGLLNGLIAGWLGLPKEVSNRLVLIGLLHDCGKALVPMRVLNAPRRLTACEFETIKMHTVYGHRLLSGFPESVGKAARGHHEKHNGTGYPDRLAGGNIPIEARITAVSDIYDAMISKRAYKPPQSPFGIMAMLKKLSVSELDPRLVNVFNKNLPEQLMNKPVLMSNGTIGLVRSVDADDVEFPFIEIDGKVVKTHSGLYCVSMHMTE
jgi:HD-GYP domain-containing protein (c-di-GMP phosphodiesterase class II)